MKKVTLKYGSEQRDCQVQFSANIGSIVSDSTNRIVLGYGDNVKALVNGVEQSMDTVVGEGTTIVLETRANQKAV